MHAQLQVFVISGGFNGWTSAKLQTKFSSSVCALAAQGLWLLIDEACVSQKMKDLQSAFHRCLPWRFWHRCLAQPEAETTSRAAACRCPAAGKSAAAWRV